MMRAGILHGLVGVVLFAGAFATAGCSHYYEEYYLSLVGTGGDAGTGGSDGGPPPSCFPSKNTKPVDKSCGVFVSSGSGDDTNGKGTPSAPYRTIGKALAENKDAIYACAGATAYSEALVIEKGVTLFGALDCGTWAYDAANKTQLTAAADEVPLKLTNSASKSTVEDFEITAADAKTDGVSSIAVLNDGVELYLNRCTLTAGKGADGKAGETPTGSGQKGEDAPASTTALDGCMMNVNGVFGGQPGVSMCGNVETSGALGGAGTNQSGGGAGTDALPQPQPNATAGHDGKAGKAQDSSSCDPGHPGADGLPGAIPGAGASGIGDLSSSGYQAPLATAGQSPGSPGYGGGGGGGAKKCANNFAGPAGGGGGAGGCGGQPGGAAQSAGSSFALVSLNAMITLDTVTLTSVDGGHGGAGGDGQPGGQGGSGGLAGGSNGDGAVKACNGGDGGQGGRGSSGGGGLGGHSAGIAFKGTPPMQKNKPPIIKHGNGGSGGIGGDMDMTSPGIVGGNGLGCATLDFTAPTSPTACAM
ncbi:PE-PGRS virulence associated protein [Minicystis rosea]|nr:PE-PGRS virulence associated protein [Minicystis rosea]